MNERIGIWLTLWSQILPVLGGSWESDAYRIRAGMSPKKKAKHVIFSFPSERKLEQKSNGRFRLETRSGPRALLRQNLNGLKFN